MLSIPLKYSSQDLHFHDHNLYFQVHFIGFFCFACVFVCFLPRSWYGLLWFWLGIIISFISLSLLMPCTMCLFGAPYIRKIEPWFLVASWRRISHAPWSLLWVKVVTVTLPYWSPSLRLHVWTTLEVFPDIYLWSSHPTPAMKNIFLFFNLHRLKEQNWQSLEKILVPAYSIKETWLWLDNLTLSLSLYNSLLTISWPMPLRGSWIFLWKVNLSRVILINKRASEDTDCKWERCVLNLVSLGSLSGCLSKSTHSSYFPRPKNG